MFFRKKICIFAENFAMKFGELYIKWIKHLKKKGLYAKYRYDYSVAVDVFNKRHRAIMDGTYWLANTKIEVSRTEKFLDGTDCLMSVKDDTLDFYGLRGALYRLESQLSMFGKEPTKDWVKVAEDFGVLEGFYERPKPSNFWEIVDGWDYGGVWATASTIDEPREVRVVRSRQDEAHAGQWYDRYYNRGRNFNNRNNIRWRR